MIRQLIAFGTLAVLTACAAVQPPDVAERRAPLAASTLPPMKTFGTSRATRPSRSNAALAQDFMELSFMMESGRKLDRFTRFEGPITIKVTGPAPPTLQPDLTRLLGRFRREAGLNIRQVPADQEASIAISVLSRRELQRVVPQAACFVVPNVQNWQDFKRIRRTRAVDWTLLEARTRAAVFLPGDVSPQEIRDCLHEEVAQALGPLNDIYRLPDSVFNDDNFHTVLTGFDMLMLRTYYSPQLRNGMAEAEVANRLPTILAQLNPRGQRGLASGSSFTPRSWIDTIETAVGPKTSFAGRRSAAKRAVSIAQSRGWTGSRNAFSLYVLGRLSLIREPELALTSFRQAGAIYRARPETRVQAAHVAMQLAAFSLSAGQADTTLALVNESLPAVAAAENAALLSTLLMIKAEALELQDRSSEARTVRQDALGWARYGFGPEQVVRARLQEISALAPSIKPTQTALNNR
ncbi:DUF2927 domain-containing protein [Actibacterium sp. 188UL27-1]|uniref:DUF2927 domain-containing protein n=1 Tax=Actibacterium sp. 188UL27-1 TaxID=2786961 RepID=UPI001957460A|nr:DUF2927 domain-containing protein [Actibacterium sp. 188UL27-1]MBM7066724.1 DUF2927 domain-containing protein [Actibacterium sp. 188UL27-1]